MSTQREGPIWTVILAVALGVAVAGLYQGTRPSRPTTTPHRAPPEASTSPHVVPGQAYAALRERRYGPSTKVSSDITKLREKLPKLTDEVVLTAGLRRSAVAGRAERRAYDGAPPTIPHAVDEKSASACLACHAKGVEVNGKVARVMSHTFRANCTQCHIPTVQRWDHKAPRAVNSFIGLPSPGEGPRAWGGAPPTIPHGIWMREDCHSCHGVAGPPGLRTTHPERVSCLQCHASPLERAP